MNGRSAEEYYYTHGKNLNPEVMEAKARASTEIDNLLDASVYDGHDDDGRDGHVHNNYPGGFDYYKTIFKSGNQYYEATISIGKTRFGDKFHSVSDIKNITQDTMDSYGENPKFHFLRDTSMENVSQGENSVKPLATDSDGNALATELPGGTISADTTRYSLSSWTDKEVKTVRKNLLKNGFTATEADKWISDVNSIAAIIAADKDRLDFLPDPDQKFKKPNGDVYKWTLDASTLCAKRLLYQGTFNAIQKALPNTPLRPGDLIELANMMHEMGYRTPCGICYVESRRRHLGNFTEEFLAGYNGEYKSTYAELTSTDGLAKLKKEHRQAYDDYIAAMNGKGVASPKVVQLRTDYRGDVRNLTKDSIAYLNSIGGLRIQSFSDFETPHLMDMMQAVIDMAAVKLKSQAYTKVPNFAWVFGDTGIKINLSLMGEGTGVDADGNLIFSNTEGMDFDEAMKLRNRYSKNVGAILVGMNDEHIIAAMGDSRIDFIIPFHRSGWSADELSRMKTLESYTDYQDSQNELWITGKDENGKYITKSIDKKTGNLDPYGENGYWEYDKSGRENAEKYLRLCAEQKRLPKFSQFLVDDGNGSFSLPQGDDARSVKIREGYWKTLIDFKMYDNDGVGAPQEAVMPNINMAEAYRVLNDYEAPKGGNNALPVADPVVDRYVEWYKENHQDNQRYSLPEANDQRALRDSIPENKNEGFASTPMVDDIDNMGTEGNPSTESLNDNSDAVKLDAEYEDAVSRGDIQKATDMLMDKLRKTNGVIPFMAPEWDSGQHRETAKLLKRKDPEAIATAAEAMSKQVPDNAVLVPMPGHDGIVKEDDWVMALTNAIAERTGRPVVVALEGAEHESRQKAKSRGERGASQEELGFRKVAEIPEGTIPIFIDNVVGKGVTADAAREAMGGGILHWRTPRRSALQE